MYARTADLDLMHGDSFHIDDLLNFSNEEIAGSIGENDHTDYWTNAGSANSDFLGLHGNSFPTTDYHCTSDFFVPFHELPKEVEWVSNFGEDPFSMENSKYTQLASLSLGDGERANLLEMSSLKFVPARARSKRSRAARDVSNWYSLHSNSPWENKDSDSCERDVRKKLQVSEILKSSSSNLGEKAESTITGRRCMHCGSERTPQWRAGPMGPKSLCNACGVRYKSGRLLPEYRPASSPSFTPSIHSNSHKNVLHIRRLKYIAPRS